MKKNKRERNFKRKAEKNHSNEFKSLLSMMGIRAGEDCFSTISIDDASQSADENANPNVSQLESATLAKSEKQKRSDKKSKISPNHKNVTNTGKVDCLNKIAEPLKNNTSARNNTTSEELIREYCQTLFRNNPLDAELQIGISKQILFRTDYPLMPRSQLFEDYYSSNTKTILQSPEKRTIVLTKITPSLIATEKQKTIDKNKLKLFTNCKSNSERVSNKKIYYYTHCKSGIMIDPSEYEKRYRSYLAADKLNRDLNKTIVRVSKQI